VALQKEESLPLPFCDYLTLSEDGYSRNNKIMRLFALTVAFDRCKPVLYIPLLLSRSEF